MITTITFGFLAIISIVINAIQFDTYNRHSQMGLALSFIITMLVVLTEATFIFFFAKIVAIVALVVIIGRTISDFRF